MPEEKYIIVLSTCPSRDEAHDLAAGLVGEKLAACVQCTPITSCYSWNDTITMAEEIQLAIKTRASLYQKVEHFIQTRHSYEVPEIVAIPILKGSASYLQWISSVTLPEDTPAAFSLKP